MAGYPDISGLAITSPTVSLSNPSPALTHKTVGSVSSDHNLHLDLSLSTALSNLVLKLIQPLAPHYSHQTLLSLREDLVGRLTGLFTPSWDEAHPQHGSGSRSLICTKQLGLPRPLREAAGAVGINEDLWRTSLAGRRTREGEAEEVKEEWEAWCDPGTVVWRYGGWEWEDVGFEPVKLHKGESIYAPRVRHRILMAEPFKVVWQATPTETQAVPAPSPAINSTPARASHAIPIRAPTVFAIPPTPAHQDSYHATLEPLPRIPSPSLLPPASIDHARAASLSVSYPRSPSPASSDFSDISADSGVSKNHSRASTAPTSTSTFSNRNIPVDGKSHPHLVTIPTTTTQPSHRGSGSGSTSSTASSVSDTNSGLSQLLTPGSRPGSADPFTMTASLQVLDDRKAPSRGRTPSPHSPASRTVTPSSTITGTPAPVNTGATTPTVTPYDGGNVTVLGGGVKLGGGGGGGNGGGGRDGERDRHGASRPSSVMSLNRTTTPGDRSRSPSVSIASRALSTALGPNANVNGTAGAAGATGARKPRTRRRIMPTYLGHLGQPGVGGPIMGVFGQFAGKPPIAGPGVHHQGYGSQPGQMWPPPPGVGVGVAPPPSMMLRGLPMVSPRMPS